MDSCVFCLLFNRLNQSLHPSGGDIAEPETVGVGGVAGRRGSPVGVLLSQQSKTSGGPAVGITADGTGSAVQPAFPVSSRERVGWTVRFRGGCFLSSRSVFVFGKTRVVLRVFFVGHQFLRVGQW